MRKTFRETANQDGEILNRGETGIILRMVLLLMGPTGAGKTTIGHLLAAHLGWTFLDADDFHSPANQEKMHAGTPLTDQDRLPWLEAIHAALIDHDAKGENLVLACSALKQSYRDLLSAGLKMKIVYLKATPDQLRHRVAARHGHFAAAAIVPGQFADLEEPGDALTVSAMLPQEEIFSRIIAELSRSK